MIPSDVKVFLASQPVDFRKEPDSLLSLVRDGGSDPFSGALYVFWAKRADRIKIVWWDGSGACLFAKRLEKSSFCWPQIGHAAIPRGPNSPLTAARPALSAGVSSKRQAGKEHPMATEIMKLRVKTGEKDGKNFWDDCGVLFIKRENAEG